VQIESDEGAGASFTIWLPLAAAANVTDSTPTDIFRDANAVRAASW
jgi:hypothetical protein